MCGRFVDPNMRSEGLDTSWIKINPFPHRYNIKPTQDILILRDGDPVMARWWLIPSWFKGTVKEWKPATFNARIEEAKGKPTFRIAWIKGRCLIPAGGYYEWTGPKNDRRPNFIRSAGNDDTLWFAGLWSPWQDIVTATIMTRAANEDAAAVHDRMPVILNPEERDAWLAGSEDLGIGAGAKLLHWPVQKFGIGDDGPDLIEPV